VNRVLSAAVALTVAAGASGVGYAVDAAAEDPRELLGPGLVTVEMDIHYSRFSAERIDVRPGTTVRFVVHNGDPINHELIVGDDEVHQRHILGSERLHPPVPGEVSLGPGETGVTVLRFDEPGTVLYACHLPAHLEYGMRGDVRVRQ
jgi:uncharacterized cupredoxin-like copper-binding protein